MPNTTAADNRADVHETASVVGWGWADEASLAAFVEQDARGATSDRAGMVHRMETTGQIDENTVAYAALYFVS